MTQARVWRKCGFCANTIYWGHAFDGRREPKNPDGTTHIADCPALFTRGGKGKRKRHLVKVLDPSPARVKLRPEGGAAMPIKGLSDRRRLPRVGKIHLGVKATSDSGREYPRAVDYFVVNADDSTSEERAKAFHDIYGEKPRELDVRFPTDDPTDWADPWFRAYSQSWGLVCKGDGETARAKWDATAQGPRPEPRPPRFLVPKGSWANSKTQKWDWFSGLPCWAEECPQQTAKPARCKMVMNLQFLLPEVRGIGVWQIDTGSWNSIRNIQDSLELVKAATGGRIRGVPLKLRLKPVEVTPPDTKTKTVWVMELSMEDLTLGELMAQVGKLGKGLLALPEPPDDERAPSDLFPEGGEGGEGETVEGEVLNVDQSSGEILPPSKEPTPIKAEQPKEVPPPNSLALHMRNALRGHDSNTCEVCLDYKRAAAASGEKIEGLE